MPSTEPPRKDLNGWLSLRPGIAKMSTLPLTLVSTIFEVGSFGLACTCSTAPLCHAASYSSATLPVTNRASMFCSFTVRLVGVEYLDTTLAHWVRPACASWPDSMPFHLPSTLSAILPPLV